MTTTKILERKPRRTRSEMEQAKEDIYELLERENPMTLRQLYYRLVSVGKIKKTEAEYKRLGRLTTEMRLRGELPFKWFSDNTRWIIKPDSFRSVEELLKQMADLYRRDLWLNQTDFVQVWSEKDALSSVIGQITSAYDVSLLVSRGFSSLTFLHKAAEIIQEISRPTYIYFVSDFDESGLRIARNVEEGLKSFAPDTHITFERIAVNEEQINDLNLITRDSKTIWTLDNKKYSFACEADAIPPNILREMVKNKIERHIDQRQMRMTKVIEEKERETVQEFRKLFKVKEPVLTALEYLQILKDEE